MTNDWRKLEGRELDRVIAEKLGWLIDFTGYWVDKSGNAHLQEDLPHYSTSVDASHALMDGVYYELCNQNGESDHGEYRLETFGEYGCVVYADTLAMVFCCAYLMRQERMEASRETD